jgi:methylthioribose-1-phosphate isomerase
MKLTPAQQKVIDTAKSKIDNARTMNFEEWILKAQHLNVSTNSEIAQRLLKYYEEEKNAVVLTHCNSKTLEKLQAFGLIEIIHDSKNDNTSYGIDKVKILNY